MSSSAASRPTFLEACLSGQALLEDVDDWVDDWHEDSDGSVGDRTLDEFLGLTELEGALWTERPEALRFIVASHVIGQPVSALLDRQEQFTLAARATDHDEARDLLRWLQATGRL